MRRWLVVGFYYVGLYVVITREEGLLVSNLRGKELELGVGA